AGGARPHHAGDLRYSGGGHRGLVVEDTPEMVPVRKDLVLVGQVGATGIDKVDARKVVLGGYLLRAQVLLHSDRIVGAALHRGIVYHDHDFAPLDATDAGNHARRSDVAAIHAPGGELADLEKRRASVQQLSQPVARQELASRKVALARLFRSTPLDDLSLLRDVGH